MNLKIIIPIVVIVIIAIGAVAYVYTRPAAPSTTGTTGPTPSSTLSGAGGTLVNPVMQVWIPGFQVVSNISVNYAAVGSGAGISQITAGTVDFGESDAPLTTAQYSALPSTLVTIPISASAVVPAYNVLNSTGKAIGNGLKFTGSVLAQIFDGNITMWNDPQLVALNPSAALPNHQILVVHRSDSSGTMFAFTDYLSKANSYWATNIGKGTAVNWPTSGPNGQSMAVVGEKGNAGVSGYILSTQYSIGPVEIAYVIQNSAYINYGSVLNAANNYILANVTNIQIAVAAASKSLPAGSANWTNVSIVDSIFTNSTATQAYPITTFTYLLAYQQQSNQAKGLAFVDFAWYIVNTGQALGKGLGYVPLPANIVALDDSSIKSITYNGAQLYTGS